MHCLILLPLSVLSLAATAEQPAPAPLQIHVAPGGNDKGPGTAAEPLATPGGAATQLAKHHAAGLATDIIVVLHAGTYWFPMPLIIGPEHLPAGGHRLTFAAAKGAKPIISGGRRITGWQVTGNGTFVTSIADVAAGKWTFRELFVNDARRPRARHPNQGYLRIVEALPDKRTGFLFQQGDIPEAVIQAAELVFLHDWSISRIPIASIDHQAHRLKTIANIGSQAKHYQIDHFEKHPRYLVENHPALLDAPGEWYLNERTGMLAYRPMPGEKPDQIDVVAPVARALLVVRGTEKSPVRNVHFKGLTLMHAAWPLPPGGYASGQATVHERRDRSAEHQSRKMMESALTFELAEDCSFTDGRLAHLGMSGLSFGSRTRRCRLVGSIIEDVSGNSVSLGEDASRKIGDRAWWQAAKEQAAAENTVAHNVIRHGGRQFFGAVAVWVGLAHHQSVTHNLIHDHPYSGISVGWMWNPNPTPAGQNIIEHNHIHHVMQVLSDGGGIYTLGRQPGSSLSHNWIHDIPANAGRAESNGMFLDQGSDQFTIAGNVIFALDRSPLRFHQAVDNLVRDNVLVVSDDQTPAIRYNRTDPQKITQADNKIIPSKSFDVGSVSRIRDAAGPQAPYRARLLQ